MILPHCWKLCVAGCTLPVLLCDVPPFLDPSALHPLEYGHIYIWNMEYGIWTCYRNYLLNHTVLDPRCLGRIQQLNAQCNFFSLRFLDPGSEMGKIRILDKHPGSATLVKSISRHVVLFFGALIFIIQVF